MNSLLRHLRLLLVLSTTLTMPSTAFAPTSRSMQRVSVNNRRDSQLSAISSPNRETILGRSGQHFKLNRFSGKVEFGSTAALVTSLDNADIESVSEWLSDEKRVAFAVWDEGMIEEMGDNIYKLKLMPLQFVTIQLAPEVDNRMWTEIDPSNGNPVFKLQSIDFDPNIQVLPGLNVPASSLGIDIEVVGELRPSRNGNGVEGKIGFVSSGNLTPPMRLLPEQALKLASNVICKTISDFAISSFQKGARSKYREFQ
eukprot:329462_1